MNSNPAIMPQRIDCGFLKTILNAPAAFFNQLPSCNGISSFGSMNHRMAPITSPATPIQIQKLWGETPPLMRGPTANCPAEPPAIPNIWVAPISVAALEAGKYFEAI